MSLLTVPHHVGHAISCLLWMGSLLERERELSCSSPFTFSKLTPGLCLLPGDFLTSCTVLIWVPHGCSFPVPLSLDAESQTGLWLLAYLRKSSGSPAFFLSMHSAHWLVTVYLSGFLMRLGAPCRQGLGSICTPFPHSCLLPTQFLRLANLPWGGFEIM